MLLGGGERLGEGGFAPQMGRELADPDGLHRRQRGVEVAGHEGGDLPERPRLDHGRQPRVAAGVEGLARRLQGDGRPGAPGDCRVPPRLPVAEGRFRGRIDLPGADQTLAVAGRDALRGGRVLHGEALAEGVFAHPLVVGIGLAADLGGDLGNLGEPMGQGAEIEAGAPDDDSGAPAPGDVRQQPGRGAQPAADRPAVGRVDRGEQVMRGLGLLLRRGSGGEEA